MLPSSSSLLSSSSALVPLTVNSMLALFRPVTEDAWWAQVGWVLFNIGEPGETGGRILHNVACALLAFVQLKPLV